MMLLVVPAEIVPTEHLRSRLTLETCGKVRTVLHRLETGFRERVIVAHPGPTVGDGYLQVQEQLAD
jgi:hypothetical protein